MSRFILNNFFFEFQFWMKYACCLNYIWSITLYNKLLKWRITFILGSMNTYILNLELIWIFYLDVTQVFGHIVHIYRILYRQYKTVDNRNNHETASCYHDAMVSQHHGILECCSMVYWRHGIFNHFTQIFFKTHISTYATVYISRPK